MRRYLENPLFYFSEKCSLRYKNKVDDQFGLMDRGRCALKGGMFRFDGGISFGIPMGNIAFVF